MSSCTPGYKSHLVWTHLGKKQENEQRKNERKKKKKERRHNYLFIYLSFQEDICSQLSHAILKPFSFLCNEICQNTGVHAVNSPYKTPPLDGNLISMCNQMVTSEIREQFHARFGNLLGFGQNASEIIP